MQPAIIYEDEDIIVCKKPAGVATQTKRIGQADMESLLKNYRASKGETPYIGVWTSRSQESWYLLKIKSQHRI